MKESTRKEFDRIKAKATRMFGTSDLSFKEYPTNHGWSLEIRLVIWAGNKVFELLNGAVSAWEGNYFMDYCDRDLRTAEQLLESMGDDYRRFLAECQSYMMEETEKAIAALP